MQNTNHKKHSNKFQLSKYEKAYEFWCEIAVSLEKEGRVIEANFPRELAKKCKAKRK